MLKLRTYTKLKILEEEKTAIFYNVLSFGTLNEALGVASLLREKAIQGCHGIRAQFVHGGNTWPRGKGGENAAPSQKHLLELLRRGACF